MAKTVVSARLDVACSRGILWFRDFVVFISPFGCQIVEVSSLTAGRSFRWKVATLLAWAILVRPVAEVIVFGFIGVVLDSHLHLQLFKARARGRTWDASGKHIRFASCSEADLVSQRHG
jgi:hypothetical protein